MRCPVCGTSAQDITAENFDKLSIRCSIDGDFDVAGDCIERLKSLDAGRRQIVLNKAIRLSRGRGVRPAINAHTF